MANGKETELKFLISEDGTTNLTDAIRSMYASPEELVHDIKTNGVRVTQGYLTPEAGAELTHFENLQPGFTPTEARLRNKGGELTFTLKGDGALERDELEVPLTQFAFESFWPQTDGRRVDKIRLTKPYGNYTIEIDFYLDRGLIVAEVELASAEEAAGFPALGQDITTDKAYKNKNLAK